MCGCNLVTPRLIGGGGRSSAGSLAMFTAMRRASSRVSSLAAQIWGYRGLVSSASIVRRRSAKACTFSSAGAMTFSASISSSSSRPSYR